MILVYACSKLRPSSACRTISCPSLALKFPSSARATASLWRKDGNSRQNKKKGRDSKRRRIVSYREIDALLRPDCCMCAGKHRRRRRGRERKLDGRHKRDRGVYRHRIRRHSSLRTWGHSLRTFCSGYSYILGTPEVATALLYSCVQNTAKVTGSTVVVRAQHVLARAYHIKQQLVLKLDHVCVLCRLPRFCPAGL